MKESIVLIGAGGHCKSCIDVLEAGGRYIVAAICDIPEKKGERILSYTVTHTDADIAALAAKYKHFLITLGHMGDAGLRKKIFKAVKDAGGTLPVIISPRAYVSAHADVAEGTIVMHDALINAGARVGEGCIINTKALIEHDAEIGAHSHISTAAVINGGAKVGAECFIGSNSVSRQGAVVADGTFVKAGSVIK
ncbi:sugar O-acyltransferase [Parelusimicrobium proximum]|uniref:NeuD/PglB/VioB family sugar acetyltransferase n=1 Tax=Parelusimicrobium proximum TaxID=3228953 RepID=UPI003D16EBB3